MPQHMVRGCGIFYCLTPARSCSGRLPDAKTGSKFSKECCRKPFSHDIGELVRGGHMENPNLTEGGGAQEVWAEGGEGPGDQIETRTADTM